MIIENVDVINPLMLLQERFVTKKNRRTANDDITGDPKPTK